MPGQGEVYQSFVTGFTPDGFHSLAQEALCDLAHLFVLQGVSSRIKTKVIRQFSEGILEKNGDIDLLCSPSDSQLLEGVIVPGLRLAVVDGPACQLNQARGQGVTLDLDVYCDRQKLQARQAEIALAQKEAAEHLDQAIVHFRQSKQIHRQIEALYVKGLNFAEADAKAEALMAEIFAAPSERQDEPLVRSFFAVAWLCDTQSMADFRLQATNGCQRRYILKGRPGTGKSFLAKKIARAANEMGYDTTLHVCSFDLNSLDGVVIPVLSVTMLDGTPTHTLEPQRAGDENVDMLECVDLNLVDEAAIEALQGPKQASAAQSQAHQVAANEARRRLEALYAEAMNGVAVERTVQALNERIGAL